MRSAKNQAYRRAVYRRELHDPRITFPPENPEDVEIIGFHREFEPIGSDEGYVLLTNGMSDRRMTMPAAATEDHAPRAELMWYVREPTSNFAKTLQWLAEFPFIDETWLGFGHRIPMPWPPVTGSDFKTFLFLTPIIKQDQRVAESLLIDGDQVEILTVNLISDAEYALIKSGGLSQFLDILDDRKYPNFLDLNRKSYI